MYRVQYNPVKYEIFLIYDITVQSRCKLHDSSIIFRSNHSKNLDIFESEKFTIKNGIGWNPYKSKVMKSCALIWSLPNNGSNVVVKKEVFPNVMYF